MRTLARRLPVLVLAVLACGVVGPARAQLIVEPPFALGAFGAVRPPAVAVGSDGNLAFLWSNGIDGRHRGAFVRIFTASGVPLGPARRVDDTGHAYDVAITASADGGYVAAWTDVLPGGPSPVYGAMLDAGGAPRGASFQIGSSSIINGVLSIASLPSGPVFLWSSSSSLRYRLYLGNGTPRGDELDQGPAWIYGDVAARPDGGFVAAWWGFSSGLDLARLFDPVGFPLGDAFPVTGAMLPTSVAVGPSGDFVVAGIGVPPDGTPGAVQFRRFTAAGTPAAPPVDVHPAGPTEVLSPVIAVDVQGNAYVAWTTYDIATERSAPLRARAYDAADAPLGPMQEIGGATYGKVRVALLPDGRFVNAWTESALGTGAVVSLCTPGIAVCGDGVLHPQCEQCDDGAANSDAAADACRTTCRLPRCGDGVADGGEECDDGNVTSCDGCSRQCRNEPGLVCGDGVTNAACGETCDDGNDVVGDGCGPTCALERIPGGGAATTDCFLEWQVNNPANVPFLDAKGAVNARQACVDDDPRCDFDGGAPGRCTFHLRACINNTDRAACLPGTRLASFDVRTPTAARAAKDVAAAATRSALLGLQGAILGPDVRDLCSPEIEITVPLRGGAGGAVAQKIVVGTSAWLYDGRRDKDKLQLTCLPPVP